MRLPGGQGREAKRGCSQLVGKMVNTWAVPTGSSPGATMLRGEAAEVQPQPPVSRQDLGTFFLLPLVALCPISLESPFSLANWSS
jgi:hypothetical protein